MEDILSVTVSISLRKRRASSHLDESLFSEENFLLLGISADLNIAQELNFDVDVVSL